MSPQESGLQAAQITTVSIHHQKLGAEQMNENVGKAGK